ncbi:hypothetical protein L208DRAFT_908450 [Tricholoma matsutake]|nr:hypothetical protein L208DRAFT_908450 [Tricholoma matsutake 945]
MASLGARQAIRISLRAPNTLKLTYGRRAIHISPVAQKKKSKVVIQDLFADGAAVEELIKPEVGKRSSVPVASSSTVLAAETQDQLGHSTKREKLSPEVRVERFNQIVDFVTPHLGRKPAVNIPKVRKSAWVHLVGLATTEEQLEKVANMFPGWKDSGHEFDPQFSELFVRRCEELSCPLLALKVFGNFSKYNLNLTLSGARQLIHSLHVEHPIDTLITASVLYPVYGLKPIAQDLVSCSMLVSACFKHNSTDSLKVAKELLPHLEAMLKGMKPLKVSQDPAVKWALKKVDKALYVKNGERVDWLSVWRTKSGHIPEL